MDIADWWRRQSHDDKCKFPTWVELARLLILLQPNSASIERVWSIFSNFFGDEDVRSLIDYINVVLLCKYNYRSVAEDAECRLEDDARRVRRRGLGLV